MAAKKSKRPFLPSSTRLSFTLVEAADLTTVSLSSLRRSVKSGALKVHRIGTRIIVTREDLEQFLRELPLGFNSRK